MLLEEGYRAVLSPEGWKKAQEIGRGRHEWNVAHGVKDKYGWSKGIDPLQKNIEGAAAEVLVGEVLGMESVGVLDGPDDGGDVGEFGVRHSLDTSYGMVLHEADADDRIFIKVVGPPPDGMMIVGYILGRDGKRSRWAAMAKDYLPRSKDAYLIPQWELRSFRDLLRWRGKV